MKGGHVLAKGSDQFDSMSAVAVDFLSGFMQTVSDFQTHVSNGSFGCFPCLNILSTAFLISHCSTEADTPLPFTDTIHLCREPERAEAGELHHCESLAISKQTLTLGKNIFSFYFFAFSEVYKKADITQ